MRRRHDGRRHSKRTAATGDTGIAPVGWSAIFHPKLGCAGVRANTVHSMEAGLSASAEQGAAGKVPIIDFDPGPPYGFIHTIAFMCYPDAHIRAKRVLA